MVWTSSRSPNFPDVPTLKELGYPMVYNSPFGIAGPKGMDPKVVAKLHDAFKKAIEDPAVIATLAKYDMVPNYKNTEDYKKFVTELTASEQKVIDFWVWRKRRISAHGTGRGKHGADPSRVLPSLQSVPLTHGQIRRPQSQTK